MSKVKTIKTDKQALIRRNLTYLLMAAPALIVLVMFNYVPMFGLVLAFKNFTYRRGIFGSEWAGLANFKYIFGSGEIGVTLRNTILYHVAFTVTITCTAIALSILLFFVKSKKAANIYQRLANLPYMVSYTVIAYIIYILLKSNGGLINRLIESFGGEAVAWYTEPKVWPFIIVLANLWFGAGIKMIYYYSAFMAVDESIFEAADMDGAKWYHKVFKIMLPSIAPTVCILLIMDLGNLLASNFSLFYSVTMDSSALYSVTDVLSTYEYRGLTMGNIGTTTALGLFTSVVQVVATLSINGIVRKIDPDSALL